MKSLPIMAQLFCLAAVAAGVAAYVRMVTHFNHDPDELPDLGLHGTVVTAGLISWGFGVFLLGIGPDDARKSRHTIIPIVTGVIILFVSFPIGLILGLFGLWFLHGMRARLARAEYGDVMEIAPPADAHVMKAPASRLAVVRILATAWDPLELDDRPGADLEYDSYADGIMELLDAGTTRIELADHLAKVERDWMGLPFRGADALLEVAAALIEAGVDPEVR